jgi:uncharacterized protein YbbC (DUF1343 family)
LADRGFETLQGKRVGLITNHTATVDSMHLIDALNHAEGVDLVALFGPEHGIRGDVQAGDEVTDGVDVVTGARIYSLYGARRSPPDSVLADLDVLLFDIQDIGARFYTYISTMGRSMQAAARAGVPFLVLDRPNPLGRRAEGFILSDSADFSFVGLYPIPVTHGMTVGELALMIRGEQMLPGLEALVLDVVPASGWDPDSLWPSYGDEWIATSPNIPDFETALVYPGSGFFEGTSWSEGRGTMTPFKNVGATDIDAAGMADFLNDSQLPGIQFESTTFVPESIPGMAESPKNEGVELQGIRLVVTDAPSFRPVATGVHLVSAAYRFTAEASKDAFFKSRWMRLISGGSRLEEMITAGDDPDDIVAAWSDEVGRFVETRRRYLLY